MVVPEVDFPNMCNGLKDELMFVGRNVVYVLRCAKVNRLRACALLFIAFFVYKWFTPQSYIRCTTPQLRVRCVHNFEGTCAHNYAMCHVMCAIYGVYVKVTCMYFTSNGD